MARFGLEDIEFVDFDVEEIEEMMVSYFEKRMDNEVTLDEADPRRKILQSVAYIATLALNNIDFTGKQTLLSYAVGDYLDHLGNSKKVGRLPATHAKTTMQFKSDAPSQFTIAAGTLVVVNDIYFASDVEVIVSSGETTVEIPFTAVEAGVEANGFLAGQITDLVEPDLIPYVYEVQNITKTDGGSEVEDDDAYAERIQLAPESFSVAGPAGAYEFHARKASAKITDVKAVRTNPGEVTVYVLAENGEMPSDELKDAVAVQLDDENVRPLTDLVIVSEPETVEYSFDVTYQAKDNATAATIEEAANKALQEYFVWQKSKLGRGIDPSELYALLQAVGAKRIVINPTIYQPLEKWQVAKEADVTLTYGGVASD